MLKPMLNLFHGEPGSKRWKAAMDLIMKDAPKDATPRGLLDACPACLPDAVLDAPPRPARLVAAVAAAGGNVNAFTPVAPRPPQEEVAGGEGAPEGKVDSGGAAADAAAPAAAGAAPTAVGAAPTAVEASPAAQAAVLAPRRVHHPRQGGVAAVVDGVWRLPEGLQPPAYALQRPLPQPEDRAAGDAELRRRRVKQQKREPAAANGAAKEATVAADNGVAKEAGGSGVVTAGAGEQQQGPRGEDAPAQQAVAA
jgi:hypothetical protein